MQRSACGGTYTGVTRCVPYRRPRHRGLGAPRRTMPSGFRNRRRLDESGGLRVRRFPSKLIHTGTKAALQLVRHVLCERCGPPLRFMSKPVDDGRRQVSYRVFSRYVFLHVGPDVIRVDTGLHQALNRCLVRQLYRRSSWSWQSGSMVARRRGGLRRGVNSQSEIRLPRVVGADQYGKRFQVDLGVRDGAEVSDGDGRHRLLSFGAGCARDNTIADSRLLRHRPLVRKVGSRPVVPSVL